MDWCPTGIVFGKKYKEQNYLSNGNIGKNPTQMSMLANTTSICEAFYKISHNFSGLYNKKAFVHHFLSDGLEQSEFDEAKNNVLG